DRRLRPRARRGSLPAGGGAARQLRRRRRGDEDGDGDLLSRRAPACDRDRPAPAGGAAVGLVLTLPELRRRVAELKAQGKKIAFANGHFDLLPRGPLRYLRAARAEGDVLVVALNDDASVARLKGPGRPLVPAAERAELLAALEPVDFGVGL